eukprot:g15951.t1
MVFRFMIDGPPCDVSYLGNTDGQQKSTARPANSIGGAGDGSGMSMAEPDGDVVMGDCSEAFGDGMSMGLGTMGNNASEGEGMRGALDFEDEFLPQARDDGAARAEPRGSDDEDYETEFVLNPGRNDTDPVLTVKLFPMEDDDWKALDGQVYATPAECLASEDVRCIPIKEEEIGCKSFCERCKSWLIKTDAAAQTHRYIHAVCDDIVAKAQEKKKEEARQAAGKFNLAGARAALLKKNAKEPIAAAPNVVSASQVASKRANFDADGEPDAKKKKGSAEKLQMYRSVNLGEIDDFLNKYESGWTRYTGIYKNQSWRLDNLPEKEVLSSWLTYSSASSKGTDCDFVHSVDKPGKGARKATWVNRVKKIVEHLKQHIDKRAANK